MLLQKQIERETEAAFGEPAGAAVAGRAALGEQFGARLARVQIFRARNNAGQKAGREQECAGRGKAGAQQPFVSKR